MPTKYTKQQKDSWTLKQLQSEIALKEGEERTLSEQHMEASQKYQVSDHVSDKNKKEELGRKLVVLQKEIANLKKNQRKLIEGIGKESKKRAVKIFGPKKESQSKATNAPTPAPPTPRPRPTPASRPTPTNKSGLQAVQAVLAREAEQAVRTRKKFIKKEKSAQKRRDAGEQQLRLEAKKEADRLVAKLENAKASASRASLQATKETKPRTQKKPVPTPRPRTQSTSTRRGSNSQPPAAAKPKPSKQSTAAPAPAAPAPTKWKLSESGKRAKQEAQKRAADIHFKNLEPRREELKTKQTELLNVQNLNREQLERELEQVEALQEIILENHSRSEVLAKQLPDENAMKQIKKLTDANTRLNDKVQRILGEGKARAQKLEPMMKHVRELENNLRPVISSVHRAPPSAAAPAAAPAAARAKTASERAAARARDRRLFQQAAKHDFNQSMKRKAPTSSGKKKSKKNKKKRV